MHRKLSRNLRKPPGQVRLGEAATAVIMFLHSFLVMAACSVVKPAASSKFIESLGPDDLPCAQMGSGAFTGFIMAACSWLMARLPRRRRVEPVLKWANAIAPENLPS